MSIGSMDAYEDEKFLEDCFIDTGEIEQLLDTDNSKCIIRARTGAGKSALLKTIEYKEDNTIILEPDELALNYIANSNILNFFNDLGIKLDIIYQLLWRHVLVVELIKKKYDIKNEQSKASFFEEITYILNRDNSKKEAIEYLMEWGDKFWLDTDKRIIELTQKLENDLSASTDFKSLGIPFSASGSANISEEKREEISQRAQSVVNDVQIQKLNRVINLLSDDIFVNDQQRYFILIDKLDDEWVDGDLRYRLIRALIETVKKFKKIGPVKIIIALREDLLLSVFDKTRDSGFQEEKYDDFILKLTWTENELHELLDKRITFLIKEQYTGQDVKFNSIFSCKPQGYKAIDYVLNRTFMRPRDAIDFVNLCIETAHGETEISSQILKTAEKKYSQNRFNALCHEWFSSYPLLKQYFNILKNKKNGFRHSDIKKEDIEELALELAGAESHDNDPIKIAAKKVFEANQPVNSIKNKILRILYKLGIIGIKKASFKTISWSYNDEPDMTESEIKYATSFEVHPMLHSILGIDDSYIKLKKSQHS